MSLPLKLSALDCHICPALAVGAHACKSTPQRASTTLHPCGQVRKSCPGHADPATFLNAEASITMWLHTDTTNGRHPTWSYSHRMTLEW